MMTPTHTHRAARTLQHDSGLRGTAELLSLSPASEQSESDIAMVTGALAGAGARQVLGERVNLPEPTIASASDLPKKAKRTSKGASKETKGSKGSSSKGSKGSRGSHNSKKSRTGSKASTSFKGSRGSVRPSMPPPPHPRSSAGSAGVCINKENNSYSWHSRSHSYAVSANMSFPYPTPWDRMRPELPTNTTGVPANLANVRTGRGRAAARTSVHVGSVGLRM
jgi:hypothetical protein